MLLPIKDLCTNYNMRINGIIHIGAHLCEEYQDYLDCKVPSDKIFWFEANEDLVKICKDKGLQIYCAAVSDKDNDLVDFIVTNNYQSSSLLELGDHLIFHPWVQEMYRKKVYTTRFDTFIKKNKIDISTCNFLNLDIQGGELSALKGIDLSHIDYIYTEVNIRELYKNCALLHELDSYLGGLEFIRVDTSITGAGWGDALYLRLSLLPTHSGTSPS